MQHMGVPTPAVTLVRRLRLMADAGGMLTRDRIKTIIEAADRIEDLDERIAIMTEDQADPSAITFPGGDDNEKY